MKYKIKDLIDSVDEHDLIKIKKDLDSGGFHFKKLIEEKVKEIELKKKGFCGVCGHDMAEKNYTYTLVFGPDDFMKKASFCETDCLEYFVRNLNNLRQGKQGGKNDLQVNN